MLRLLRRGRAPLSCAGKQPQGKRFRRTDVLKRHKLMRHRRQSVKKARRPGDEVIMKAQSASQSAPTGYASGSNGAP